MEKLDEKQDMNIFDVTETKKKKKEKRGKESIENSKTGVRNAEYSGEEERAVE